MLPGFFSQRQEWDTWDDGLVTELKALFHQDPRVFYDRLRELLARVNTTVSCELLKELYLQMDQEFNEAAPFIAGALNRVFSLILRKNYFSFIPVFTSLMEAVGSRELLDQLKQLLNLPDLSRSLSTLDIYNIKKTIYQLANRFSQKDELVYRIEMEIRDLDLEWQDDIEV